MTGFESTSREIWSSSSVALARSVPSASEISKYFPCRTAAIDLWPCEFKAEQTVWPWGPRTGGFMLTKTRVFMEHPFYPGRTRRDRASTLERIYHESRAGQSGNVHSV